MRKKSAADAVKAISNALKKKRKSKGGRGGGGDNSPTVLLTIVTPPWPVAASDAGVAWTGSTWAATTKEEGSGVDGWSFGGMASLIPEVRTIVHNTSFEDERRGWSAHGSILLEPSIVLMASERRADRYLRKHCQAQT